MRCLVQKDQQVFVVEAGDFFVDPGPSLGVRDFAVGGGNLKHRDARELRNLKPEQFRPLTVIGTGWRLVGWDQPSSSTNSR